MTDTGLLALLGALHLLALACGTVLILLLLRPGPDWRWWSDDDEHGGGGEAPDPVTKPKPPADGLPLPDASPAAVRLRGPAPPLDRRSRPRRPGHPVPDRRPVPNRQEVR